MRALPFAVLLICLQTPAVAQFGGNLTTAQERELGRQAAAEVDRKNPVVRDKAVQSKVNALGQRLARRAGRNLPYTFKVLDIAEVNAFALPGGYIYVNRGVLRLAGSDSEIGGVLAHEIAHVARRHSVQQVQRAQRLGLGLGLLDLVLGSRGAGGAVANTAAQMVGEGVFLKYSRDAEREADRDAVTIMRRAGMDPRALLTFVHRMAQLQKSNPGTVATFFSTHPSLEERERNIGALVASRGQR
jgi:beta-barrel assembly-enhancing protease